MRLLALAALVVATGCANSARLGPNADEVVGTESLVRYLEDVGFTLAPAGLTSSTVPLAVSATYRVTGVANPSVIEVFEFETDEAAEDGLTQLRAEIRSRVRQEVYARGPLVVYYRPAEYRRGDNRSLRLALADALGGPRGGA
ncbi:hypothetical protein [Rubrivirga marina]|uniref:Uncharacterized protein n=1 Tax=Rubrivirga marina TaxID=1196024 RepID=A0A271J5M2_9BACT|nr:hypothetical protein [Rubrivirga marina]PAP78265.1 hypothetical protein BSZ37_18455 [Rubrivirga marina]